jgi:hypothetical protein
MRDDQIMKMTQREYGVAPTSEGAIEFERAVWPESRRRSDRRRFRDLFPHGSAPPVFEPYDGRVDPMAFVHAARVLGQQHGFRDVIANPKVHGGWDSQGHWGLCGDDVRRAWYAAGCRPTRKFKALVRLGGQADPASQLRFRKCKRLSLRQISDAARALRRTSAKSMGPVLSTKLLCALGRLCPELQRVALSTLPPVGSRSPFRIRHVDWDRVAEVQDQIPVDRQLRVAWSAGKRQQILADMPAREIARWLGYAGKNLQEACEAVRSDVSRAFVSLVLRA